MAPKRPISSVVESSVNEGDAAECKSDNEGDAAECKSDNEDEIVAPKRSSRVKREVKPEVKAETRGGAAPQTKAEIILRYSDPVKVQAAAYRYLGDDAVIHLSDKLEKKYKIWDKIHRKWVHFGQMGYEDYTRHNDDKRRENYLRRSTNIRGNWKENPYSPNNLSINILW